MTARAQAGPGGEPFPGDAFDDPFADGAVEAAGRADAAGPEPDIGRGAQGVEGLLRQAADMVASARRAPLSSSVLVQREELLEVIQSALDRLPDELRQARWLLREREEFLEQRQREADALLDQVRAQAERMVQRTEIARQADRMAQRLVAEAREDARRLRHEAEDFCDKHLAKFEIVLDRTMRTVRAGRDRLSTPSEPVGGTTTADGAAQGSEPGSSSSPAAAFVPAGAGQAAAGGAADPLFDQDQP